MSGGGSHFDNLYNLFQDAQGDSSPERGTTRVRLDDRRTAESARSSAGPSHPPKNSLKRTHEEKAQEARLKSVVISDAQDRRQALNKRICKFGKYRLPLMTEGDERKFRPLRDFPVDQQQVCLLDAIWSAQGTHQVLNACCALQVYLSKIREKPRSKAFSHYALITGPGRGIYNNYIKLCAAKSEVMGAIWKGFYSIHEAKDWYRLHLDLEPDFVEKEELTEEEEICSNPARREINLETLRTGRARREQAWQMLRQEERLAKANAEARETLQLIKRVKLGLKVIEGETAQRPESP